MVMPISKDDVREMVWSAIEEADAAHTKKVHDRIPFFRGAEQAAERVFELEVWQNARVIKGNPDKPQGPLRKRALEEGKTVYMAVPRLKQEKCFVELDPAVLGASPSEASTISGAFRHGRLVAVEEMRPVDLVISGSVAVNRQGTRVGKGGGFADLEYGLAIAAGVVRLETPVVSTVHAMQVLDTELPWTHHDVCLDFIATPDELIRCEGGMPRPQGIYWEDLDEAKIRKIPVLQKLRASMGPVA
ncbi:MAG: 5-formyltetrahydrofolate cyclo-ligase [Euryarchaeota archaeon]|nr:5-formyltetrahydrofolate cyclo-ligase [Euryarchaeota archaeon]